MATLILSAARTAEVDAYRAADERIAAAWDVYHELKAPAAAIDAAIRQAYRFAGFERPARSPRSVRYLEHAAKLEEQRKLLQPAIDEAREAALALDRELYTGWSRFFFVQHIHNTMHCSSFRPTTRVLWLPDVSGLTEAEAVTAHGETLCTKCFPSAPVELTTPKVDPTVCPGSGRAIDRSKLTGREDAYYSPSGTCSTCGQAVSLTSRRSGKVRKHKAA